jgi:hypothetical protein
VGDADETDVRADPAAYEVGRGEHGAFEFQPYKTELLDLWGIKTEAEAEEAAAAIHQQFREYRAAGDLPGMDMARKYLQMGWTRSLRYAKYPGGRKYDDDGTEREPQEWYDEEKYRISQIYRERLDAVRADETYQRAREAWTDGDTERWAPGDA